MLHEVILQVVSISVSVFNASISISSKRRGIGVSVKKRLSVAGEGRYYDGLMAESACTVPRYIKPSPALKWSHHHAIFVAGNEICDQNLPPAARHL